MTTPTVPLVKKVKGEKPEICGKEIAIIVRASMKNLTEKFYTIQIVEALHLKDNYANRRAVNSALGSLKHLGILNVGGSNQNYHWHIRPPASTLHFKKVRLIPGYVFHQKNLQSCPH